MSCPNLTLTPCLGETYRIRVLYQSAGAPIDITGWTVTWTITASETIVYTDPPNVEVAPLLGQIDLLLDTQKVEDLAGATVHYSLVGTNPDVPAGEGDYALLEGRIRVE